MVSSGDDGGGGMPQSSAHPMGGLPVAGQSAPSDPYEYGKFQNFLPDAKGSGPNPMATGLRPGMFDYTSPGGGGPNPQLEGQQGDTLRNALSTLLAEKAARGGG